MGLEKNIFIDRLKISYSNAFTSVIATILNTFILGFVLWNVSSKLYIISWCLINLLVTAIRYKYIFSFKKEEITDENAAKWSSILTIGLVIAGGMWGLAGIYLFPINSPLCQTFLILVLGGMIAGTTAAYSVILINFLIYALLVGIPIIIQLFLFGTMIHSVIGFLFILFLAIMTLDAKHIKTATLKSIILRYENTELLEKIKNEKDETVRLYNQLQKSNEKIKTLKGLLPICASCQKIRDDNGNWYHVEEYIQDHSSVEFSHGICPDCRNKLYPNIKKS